MKAYQIPGGAVVKHWTEGVEFEDEARKQVHNVATLPFVRGVAVMPDVHWGMGATVGSVIATHQAIIPAAVGVDIGCGMIAQETGLTASDLPDSLAKLRSDIERAIPHGGPGRHGSWEEEGRHGCPASVSQAWKDMSGKYDEIVDRFPKIGSGASLMQLGTLGTGNHFVEVCLDGQDKVWVMLHSGSRGLGNRVGSFFIEMAKKEMRRWHVNLPDQDLAYLPQGSEFFGAYVDAVKFAQGFAFKNRELMMSRALDALRENVKPFQLGAYAVNCHHNYVAMEHHGGENVWVTRKGAVSAKLDELGIIPGSMGAKSYIVRGLGNQHSFTSCSHGAGRRMSRGKAKKTFTLEDHAAATFGIECRKDAGVIDETPGAYKSIDAVMEAQKDLVEPVAVLRQVLCVKG